MAALTTQSPSITGTAIAYTAASAGGDTIPVSSNVYLLVNNNSASSITVTIVTPGNEFNGLPVPDTTVTVPATTDVLVPVKHPSYQNSSGNASITYSAVTSVLVAALGL